jgi:SOS-response transcriptional repressor LexA
METELQQILNDQLRIVFDGNASELARVVGTSQQNISNFLNGDVLKPSYWKRAAEALEIPENLMESLIDDAKKQGTFVSVPTASGMSEAMYRTPAAHLNDMGVPTPTPTPNHPRPMAPPTKFPPIPNATVQPQQGIVTTNKMLPVLGEAVGGVDGKYIFNGSIIDYVVCPPSLENVAGAYAVYIDGESMYPRYKAGETAWVHPNKPARRGDDVIVQIHPPEDDGSPPWGYVKEFVGWSGDRLVLNQFNPAGEIRFDRSEVVSIHPIVLSGKY